MATKKIGFIGSLVEAQAKDQWRHYPSKGMKGV